MKRLLLVAVACLALACAGDRTQIMVEVDSDLSVPGELDGVEVVVTGLDTSRAMGSLVEAPLPRTVGLVPSGDSLGPIEVRAFGTLGGVPVVERRAITSFVGGRTLRLPMFLSRSCRGMDCVGDTTCDDGVCVSAVIDPSTLEEWPGADAGPRRDAGPIDRMDAGIDGGGLDAGDLDAGPPIDATTADAGAPDSGGVDAGTGTDAGPSVDAGSDAGPPDAGPPDAGPPDAGPPDAGLTSCSATYGGAASYQLCAERATECEFYTLLGGSTCAAVCSAAGGSCIATYSNGVPALCNRASGARACTSPHNDEICVCTRVP